MQQCIWNDHLLSFPQPGAPGPALRHMKSHKFPRAKTHLQSYPLLFHSSDSTKTPAPIYIYISGSHSNFLFPGKSSRIFSPCCRRKRHLEILVSSCRSLLRGDGCDLALRAASLQSPWEAALDLASSGSDRVEEMGLLGGGGAVSEVFLGMENGLGGGLIW